MSILSSRGGPAGFALAATMCVVLGVASGAGGAPLSVAPGGPGALSHFDLARKDCLGTARNTTSKDRLTVAGGALGLYVRFDPTVNGNGGGGGGNGGGDSASTDTSTGHTILVASDPSTATNAVNRDYAQPVYAALDGPFGDATNGFAGTASDGLTQLDASHALTTSYTTASNGNVVQTARVSRGRDEGGGNLNFTLALGFGASQAAAVQTA